MPDAALPGRATLTSRLLALFALAFLAVLVAFSAVVTNSVRTVLQRQITDALLESARLAALDLDDSSVDEVGRRIVEATGARFTVIDVDGVVVYDSASDAESMENHRGRPEVDAALAGTEGTDLRVSATTGVETLYAAVPSDDGRVVRLALTAEQLEADLSEVGSSVLIVATVAGVVGVLLVWFLSRRITEPIRQLTALADRVASGEGAVEARRSSVFELDRLGVAIGRISTEIGQRVTEVDNERRTLEAVLSALPQGVVLVSGDDQVLYSNPAVVGLLGAIPDRITSITPRTLHRCVRDARSTGEVREDEFERGAPARVMNVVATRLPHDNRVLVVITDVTERRRVEAMRRDFVADASHELKTPVAAVLASAEALQLALDRDPQRAADFGHRVEASARQLSRLVADLLDLSRLEASDQPMEHAELGQIVDDEVSAARRRAEEAGIRLQSSVSAVTVMGRGADLALAVRNLVDNAIRYTDRGGTVSVSCNVDNGFARIVVSDTGQGIPSRALGRVFERFYRVDEARSRDTGGTGLGLAIVRHVAERHGGTVTVTSQLGSGSTFTIEIPVASR